MLLPSLIYAAAQVPTHLSIPALHLFSPWVSDLKVLGASQAVLVALLERNDGLPFLRSNLHFGEEGVKGGVAVVSEGAPVVASDLVGVTAGSHDNARAGEGGVRLPLSLFSVHVTNVVSVVLVKVVGRDELGESVLEK